MKQQDINELITNGTDEEKMQFIVENTLVACEALGLCPGCIGGTLEELVHSSQEHEQEGRIH